jgi:hypothetical protein
MNWIFISSRCKFNCCCCGCKSMFVLCSHCQKCVHRHYFFHTYQYPNDILNSTAIENESYLNQVLSLRKIAMNLVDINYLSNFLNQIMMPTLKRLNSSARAVYPEKTYRMFKKLHIIFQTKTKMMLHPLQGSRKMGYLWSQIANSNPCHTMILH